MADYPPTFQELVGALRQLPSVGARSAERLALFLLGAKPAVSERLARALLDAVEKIVPCARCGFHAEKEEGETLCPICRDPARDASVWCLVEEADDVVKFEKAAGPGAFRGLYHVLGGKLSPLEGIGPEELRIGPLLARLETARPKEIILALGTDVEGETTALYLAPLLKERGVGVTRLATGLPAGGGLEFADSVTLGYALAGRHAL